MLRVVQAPKSPLILTLASKPLIPQQPVVSQYRTVPRQLVAPQQVGVDISQKPKKKKKKPKKVGGG